MLMPYLVRKLIIATIFFLPACFARLVDGLGMDKPCEHFHPPKALNFSPPPQLDPLVKQRAVRVAAMWGEVHGKSHQESSPQHFCVGSIVFWQNL